MTAGSVRRRAGAAVAAALAALLPLGGAAVGPAAVGPAAAAPAPSGTRAPGVPPAPEGPVTVEVEELPRVLAAGDPFLAGGTLRAARDTAGTLTGLRLRVVRGERLVSRSQLARATTDPDAEGVRVLDVPLEGSLEPGGTLPWATTPDLDVDALGLGAIGVYPLTVQVRGRLDGGSRRLLGSVQTYLPWFPEDVDAPTRLAWLWPLVDVPRRGPDRVLRDDVLAGSLAATGRLGGLLEAAIQGARRTTTPGEVPVPVTVVTDPDLLETARQMKGGYQVAGEGTGSGTAAAERWLARLAGFTRDRGVVPLPYADPDVTALVRGGVRDLVRDAVRDARGTAPEVLGVPERAGLAWPPGGALTPEALALLQDEGARTVVLGEDALPLAEETYPPTQPALAPADALGAGRPRALVADAGLTALLAADPDAYGGVRLAEQRWLAETAMITAERPGARPRTLLVAPPRRWAAPRLLAQETLRDTGRVPWLRPATLTELLDGPVSADRAPLTYPAAARAQELPPGVVGALERVAERLDVLADVLVPAERAEPLLRPVSGALRAAGSSAWREGQAGGLAAAGTAGTAGTGGAAFRRAVADRVEELRDAVGVARPAAPLTLTSSSGEIRVGVVNSLPDVSVRARLQLAGSARLRVAEGSAEVRELPPGYNQVRVALESGGPGLVTLEARLVTPDGRPITDGVPIRVRSTAYGRTALAITGAALGVLLAAVGVRLARRGWRGRRPGADA